MSVTVETSATSRELTTLTAVKDELEITSTADDSYLQNLITRATDLIEQQTDRKFARQTYKETLGGTASPRLVVSRVPVQSIDKVVRDDTTVSSTAYLIEDPDAGLLWNKNEWDDERFATQSITRIARRFQKRIYEITYEAGYYTPGTTDGTRDLPHDLELAAIEIVKWLYTERGQNPNARVEEVGETRQEKYGRAAEQSIPPRIGMMLSKYEQVDLP